MTTVSQPPPPSAPSKGGLSGLTNPLKGADNGSVSRSVGLPTAPRRQRNTTWLLVGALLVVGSGIAALSMASSLADRVEVVVAARDIAEGEVLATDDFTTADVGLNAGVVAVNPDDVPNLVGKVAAGPIGEGAIVHPDYFLGGLGDGTKSVIVGLNLDPGEYPRVGLQPGDQMVIIAIAEDSFGEITEGSREIGEGEVVEVVELVKPDAFLVSLRVETSIASRIATVSSEDRVALAQKELADTEAGVRPLAPVEPADPLTGDEPGSDVEGSSGVEDGEPTDAEG